MFDINLLQATLVGALFFIGKKRGDTDSWEAMLLIQFAEGAQK